MESTRKALEALRSCSDCEACLADDLCDDAPVVAEIALSLMDERDTLADRVTALEDAIKEAVGYLREDWEADEPINGGDLVNWFGEWRIRAAKVLEVER